MQREARENRWVTSGRHSGHMKGSDRGTHCDLQLTWIIIKFKSSCIKEAIQISWCLGWTNSCLSFLPTPDGGYRRGLELAERQKWRVPPCASTLSVGRLSSEWAPYHGETNLPPSWKRLTVLWRLKGIEFSLGNNESQGTSGTRGSYGKGKVNKERVTSL